MADTRISDLPALAGSDLMGIDLVAVADLSASETKKLTAKDLVQNGAGLIDDGTIPGVKLVADSVTAAQLAPDSVTDSELANNAVDTAAIADLAVTNSKIASGVDGAKLTDDTVTAAKIPATSLDRGIDKTGGAIGHTNAVTPGTSAGISFDAQGHVTGTTPLVPSDLPLATTTAVGAVSIPVNSGLSVSGTGAVTHGTTVTAGSVSGITFSQTGHITATRALEGSDLPSATSTTKGGVSVPGPGLAVSSAGAITHVDSGVGAGTYTKVTVNGQGHVTTGASLTSGDIPSLDASKIATGTFGSAFIANRSVTLAKLADYSVSYIQEATPPLTGNHIGALWYQESTAGLHMWNGNSWMPVSIGRLSQENLRYCGTIDATTGLITGVTPFGTAAGYSIGNALKNAADDQTGIYFVVDVAGSGIPQASVVGVAFDTGDWVLCNGAAAGYVRIDTLNGGGGGGGAAKLGDLLDVTLTTPTDGQMFVYTAAGQWVNTSEVVGGTY